MRDIDYALFEAVAAEDETMVKKLIKLGANPMVKQDEGETPLDWAAKYNQFKDIAEILKAAANGKRRNGKR